MKAQLTVPEKQKVEVVFRKYDNGEIVALFPHNVADCSGACSGYTHIGQHTACDYDYTISITKPAKSEEYQDLFNELEKIGYKVKVIKKRDVRKFTKELQEAFEYVEEQKTEFEEKPIDIEKRRRQVRDALNKTRSASKIESCAEILEV